MERDIRMRSGSPRMTQNASSAPTDDDELVYEWKSGSILEPDHAWSDSGFILHLNMAYRG
jgi:hypothetical protein